MAGFDTQAKKEIDALAAYLTLIASEDQQVFDEQFHARLKRINELSLNCPEKRDELIRYCSRSCAYELDRGAMSHYCRNKPLGYAGDYLVNDWIYKNDISSHPVGGLWDAFYQRFPVAQSLRNRKEYLCNLFCGLSGRASGGISALNLGCGSCRDVADAIDRAGHAADGSRFHCVDQERIAIEYAKKTIHKAQTTQISFQWEVANVLQFQTVRRYGLVWAGGLFDFLEDHYAKILLKAMWNWVDAGGQIVFSNLHPDNPSRNAMEWCWKWFLNYRTKDDLRMLCDAAGIPQSSVRFEQEPLGICIFCVITGNPVK